jgi:hypothetical protein
MPSHNYSSRSNPVAEDTAGPTQYHVAIGDPGISPLGNYVR